MVSGWGVKAGMACLQVKLCVAVSERLRKHTWYLKALYKCPDLLLLYFYYIFQSKSAYLQEIIHLLLLQTF